MLVRQSTYNTLLEKCQYLERDVDRLVKLATKSCDLAVMWKEKYNTLADEHLRKVMMAKKQTTNTFTEDELKSLLALVHPDKHQNRSSAVQQNATVLTQKILKLVGK